MVSSRTCSDGWLVGQDRESRVRTEFFGLVWFALDAYRLKLVARLQWNVSTCSGSFSTKKGSRRYEAIRKSSCCVHNIHVFVWPSTSQ
jgi:hypothetical protein